MQPQDPNTQPQSPQPSNAPYPAQEQGNQPEPQQMYYQRPLQPEQPVMSEEVRQKHDASKKKYPKLNLSEGEFIIRDVKRHPIGLIQIWVFVAIVVAAVLGLLAIVMALGSFGASGGLAMPLAIGALLICALALLFGYIGTYVYTSNRFYLTNESVIQNIQNSLFSNREQTVSLGNVEDASYSKHGILQHMFDYGQIRLSTQGDETTYRFNYASQPSQQVAELNNAVEAFKNGRPVAH